MQGSSSDNALNRSVISTLLYYDIFQYPLKADEVFHYLDRNSVTIEDVKSELNRLNLENDIYKFEDFFSIVNDPSRISRRLAGNALAEKLLPVAKQKALLIASFPFVRGVMASGSLSKGYMEETSDLDFFIITAKNRVWIARMLLVLYKRIFLKNSHQFFCVNYFIDEEHLEIEEKNIFTATELSSLLPLYGEHIYHELIHANKHWLCKFFPNFKPRNTIDIPSAAMGAMKFFFESFITILGGDLFEKLCMNATLKRWKKKHWNNYSLEDFEIAFKSKKYVSKNHPRNFQKKVMELFHQKVSSFQFEKEKSEI